MSIGTFAELASLKMKMAAGGLALQFLAVRMQALACECGDQCLCG